MTNKWSSAALVLVAHGSHRHPIAGELIHRHATAIRDRHLFGEVVVGFWHGTPELSEILSTVSQDTAFVVPVFKSDGHFTQTIIPREMDLAGLTTSRTDASGPSTVHLCLPVGGHPKIPSLVEVLLLDACKTLGVSADKISALIVGHGGKTSSNSEAATDRVVKTLRENNNFGSVHGLYLEQEPNLDDWRETVKMNNVVAVPFLIGGGGHEIEIPDRMGSIDFGRLVVTVPVGEMRGISQLIIDQVAAHPASGIQHSPA